MVQMSGTVEQEYGFSSRMNGKEEKEVLDLYINYGIMGQDCLTVHHRNHFMFQVIKISFSLILFYLKIDK